MSLTSMLKSIFRSRKQPETHYTILLVWEDGFRLEGSPTSVWPYVEGMLQVRHQPQRVEIWRHSGPLRGIGPESAADRLLLSLCPQNLEPVIAGSLGQRHLASFGPLDALNISGDSFSSGSTQAHVQARSSNLDGTR